MTRQINLQGRFGLAFGGWPDNGKTVYVGSRGGVEEALELN